MKPSEILEQKEWIQGYLVKWVDNTARPARFENLDKVVGCCIMGANSLCSLLPDERYINAFKIGNAVRNLGYDTIAGYNDDECRTKEDCVNLLKSLGL